MKALILAGGRGSRLNELTKNKNKSMINLFEKPLIEYNLEQAAEIKVKEIILVVGYRAEEIRKYVGNEYRGIKVSYVMQKKQKGVVNAIECARKAIGESDFLLMLADEIVPEAKIKEMYKKFRKEDLFALCGVVIEKEKSSIAKTYSAMIGEEGRIFRLIEKPRFPINNLKGTGHCIMKNEMLEYIERTPINMNRNQKELVDMIQCAVDEGRKIKAYNLAKSYVNVNNQEDLDLAKKLIKKDNPKVLIVHPQFQYFGGAELLIVELCNWLTKRGIKNDILTLNSSEQVESSLINTEIIIPKNEVKINSKGFESANEVIKGTKVFRKTVKKIYKNYDVINFHNYPTTWALWPRKKPCVWMLNEPPNLWSRPDAGLGLKIISKVRNWLDKFIVRTGIDVICVADEFNKQRTFERYKQDSKIVYYGVNHEFFSKGKAINAIKKFNLKNKFVVVQSGVLSDNKNQLDSLKAISFAKQSIPNLLMVFAGKGEGEYEKILHEFIKNNGLEKNVLFTGNLNREELRDLYSAASVGLFPVGKQGGWLAPFEMLCSNRPIITSEELGASSVIKKFDLGIVTNNYANALEEVYKNQNQYNKKSKLASEFVRKNLGWNVFTDKLIRAYKQAIIFS